MVRALACDVWLADISVERPRHQDLLDETERGRRAAYRWEADRSRFTVAAVLLRLVTAELLGTAPALVPVDRTCADCGKPHGRPRIAGTDVQVSISHSGDTVAVATTRAAAIGVDIEQVGADDVSGTVAAVLGAGERLAGPEDFYTYWCRKEAVVKATGEGLGAPLTEVLVSAPHEPARLLSYRGNGLTASLHDLPVPPGYAGAVALLADGAVEARLRDGSALLAG